MDQSSTMQVALNEHSMCWWTTSPFRLNLFLKADKYTSEQQIDYILVFYEE